MVFDRLKRHLFLSGLPLIIAACSPVTHHYVQVEYHLSRQDFAKADAAIEKQAGRYGSRNELLYHLDRAMTLHLAGKHAESNRFLDQAERIGEDLYTKSIAGQAGALLTNDNTLPYEGEDFERVMIHLISALNYVFLGELDEALVEARKVDHQLNLLNDRYDKKNVYKEDAFARYLSGILYEARGEWNDSWIANRKAYEAYQVYREQYEMPVPERLKADLLRITDYLGLTEEHEAFREAFGPGYWAEGERFKRDAEIILISYQGLSPIKEDFFITAPVPDGKGGVYILNIAMPRFIRRPTDLSHAVLKAWNSETESSASAVLVEDIGSIAVKDLEDRIGRITAKAIARATAKYLASLAIRDKAEDSGKPLARVLANVGTNLYSLLSEQSDKRSWRTLPGQIHMARLRVSPGTYNVEARYMDTQGQEVFRTGFENIRVGSGEKKFLSARVVGRPLSPDRSTRTRGHSQ